MADIMRWARLQHFGCKPSAFFAGLRQAILNKLQESNQILPQTFQEAPSSIVLKHVLTVRSWLPIVSHAYRDPGCRFQILKRGTERRHILSRYELAGVDSSMVKGRVLWRLRLR